jgi:integrase
MGIPMTGLRRAANGDWFSRKAIPENVREAYQLAHGVSREERFRRPGSLPQARAVAELRDWDAEVSGRIDALRAAREGRGRDLTKREAHALAGAWYGWFVQQHENEPGEVEGWALEAERIEDAYSRFAPADADLPGADGGWVTKPGVRRHVRAVVATIADAQRFLAERHEVLTNEADALFLDVLEDEVLAALALLKRRAGGDYGHDPRPQRFPSVAPEAAPTVAPQVGHKAAGMDCGGLFAAWVKERRPAPSTVDRWRSVFVGLDKAHGGRDAGAITEDDARAWADTLVTAERSARVANEVWLRAASVVWTWAAGRKLVAVNPFLGISIAAPKAPPKLREREFNDAEWRVILRAALADGGPPAKPASAARRGQARSLHKAACRRWAPWLCAYTGARPGEVTQLRGEDVQQHPAGFWFLRLTPEAGAIKTSEARSVPLHSHLVEQGFLEFVKAAGSAPLFYDPASTKATSTTDPTNPARHPAVIARQKLSEWVRSLGVTDPGISPSHAWRHTWKRRAFRAGMEKGLRDAWCGHAPATEGDRYERPTLEDLAASLPLVTRYDLEGENSGAGQAGPALATEAA